MRVLHIYNGKLYGGVETTLAILARHRDADPGMEQGFALCYEGLLSRELQAAGVEVHQLGEVRIRRPFSIWRARRRLREVLRSGRYDLGICHMPWSKALLGPAVQAEGLPLVFWLHDVTDGRHWLERWARLRGADFGLSNSRFLQNVYASIYPGIPTDIIYPPVEPPDLGPARGGCPALRKEFDTPEDAVVILQVSRMEAWKGHRLHLEALSRVKTAKPWVCWFVGWAQRPHEVLYLEELKRLAARLGIEGKVRFLGRQPDVSKVLACADIFSQPNLHPEGVGYAFPKAFYAKLPVVTTDLGGVKEIVDESCGFIVAPEDPAALADALDRLIGDRGLRLKMGAAGFERAKGLCDARGQVERLGRILRPVAGLR